MPRTWSAVLARTGVKTGDGRILAEGAGTSRSLPLPLMYQPATDDGHGGAVVVGRIESIRFGDGMVTATGSMLEDGGWAALESLEAGVIGPSVDLDDIEYVMDADENIVLTQWRVAGATLVAVPAFADVSLTLDPLPVPVQVPVAPDGYDSWDAYSASLTTFALGVQEAQRSTAVLPPKEWFEAPEVDGLTPLTVAPDGRVFGHIAPWGECHIGLPGCVTAPFSSTGYSHFMVGSQAVQGGGEVPVGTLVTGPRHADPQLAFKAAQQHYDDVSSAVAKVVAGEDRFGIWVAGWMLPGADPAKVEQFMSSPVSGDWRRIGGSLEMIAVCSVNAPGFPVPRARVSFANEEQRTFIGTFGIKAGKEVPGESGGSVAGREADDADVLGVAPDAVRSAQARWARHEWDTKVGQ